VQRKERTLLVGTVVRDLRLVEHKTRAPTETFVFLGGEIERPSTGAQI
jgi:hypothetical protein